MTKAVIAADRSSRSARKYFDEMDRLFGASIGVVIVRTREIERARSLTHEWCSLHGHGYHVWDHNHGFRRYSSIPTTENGSTREIQYDASTLERYLRPQSTIPDTQQIIAAFEWVESGGAVTSGAPSVASEFNEGRICTFLDLTEEELNHPCVTQFIRDHVNAAHDADDRIFLMVQPHVPIPDSLRHDIEMVELETPSFIELVDTLSELASTSIQEALEYELSSDDIEEISQNGLGMTEQEFSNAVAIATVDLGKQDGANPSVRDFVRIVRSCKLGIIRQTEVLDLIEPAEVSSVGGLDLLKADLEMQRSAFSQEARDYGLDMPKGYIVVGQPGTGKTLICKATSAALGLPAIVFNLSAVFSSYVGSSEARMRANLKFVEAMAPCILFLDEFDKSCPQGNENDSGTSSRILGTLLTWLNDRQERGIPVYVIASANDVTRLPPEVLRKGRFDNIWAVNAPSAKERADILRIHLMKRGHSLSDDELQKVAAATSTFVGAELESVVTQALLLDFNEGNETITCDNVIKVAQSTIPQARSSATRIKAMEDWAKENAKPASSGGEFDNDAVARTSSTRRIIAQRRLRGGRQSGHD